MRPNVLTLFCLNAYIQGFRARLRWHALVRLPLAAMVCEGPDPRELDRNASWTLGTV
jgi:hypothetical protein